jgi:hypothetical protein
MIFVPAKWFQSSCLERIIACSRTKGIDQSQTFGIFCDEMGANPARTI